MSKSLEELSYIKENHLQLAKEKYRKLEPKMLEDVLTRKAKHYDIIEKELKALNEILVLHHKWLRNEISDFEFFTLLVDIRDKYGLLSFMEVKNNAY